MLKNKLICNKYNIFSTQMTVSAYFLDDYGLTVETYELRAVPDVTAVQLVRSHVVATFD